MFIVFQSLLVLEIQTIIAFLPTLMNQLFGVLTTGGSEVAVNVTRVLVHIIHQVYETGREDILYSYVKVRISFFC